LSNNEGWPGELLLLGSSHTGQKRPLQIHRNSSFQRRGFEARILLILPIAGPARLLSSLESVSAYFSIAARFNLLMSLSPVFWFLSSVLAAVPPANAIDTASLEHN